MAFSGVCLCCTGLHYCSRPSAEQFPVPPGQWFIVAIYFHQAPVSVSRVLGLGLALVCVGS